MRTLLFMTLFCLILSSIPDDLQARRRQKPKNIKIGLQRWVNNVTYNYQTRTDEGFSNGELEETNVSSSGEMSDTALLMEYVIATRVGVEAGVGLIPSVRDFELKTDRQTIGDVKQTLTLSYYFGLNAYFSAFTGNGFKPFAGIGISSFQVSSVYSNGGRINIDLSADESAEVVSNFPEKQTMSAVVQGQYLKLGFDWMIDAAGLRVQYVYLQDAKTTTEQTKKTLLDQKQQETIQLNGGINIGIFFAF